MTSAVLTLVNADQSGNQIFGHYQDPVLALDPRGIPYIAFSCPTGELVSGASNNQPGIFVKDLVTGQTTLASTDSVGNQANALCGGPALAIDSSGTPYVAFWSVATNLVASGSIGVFLKDLASGATSYVGPTSGGTPYYPSIATPGVGSASVVFWAAAQSVDPTSTNGNDQVYLSSSGATAIQTTMTLSSSANPSLSGEPVTFTATVANASGAGGTPTGAVQFLVDGSSAGSSPLNAAGMATYTTSMLGIGSHTVTAIYAGDGAFLASTPTSLQQMVKQPLPAISPTSLSWNITVGGIDFSFAVQHAPTAAATVVNLYWAAGTSSASIMGGLSRPAFSFLVGAGTTSGTYGPLHVSPAVLGPPPGRAAYLLEVTDPANVLGGFSDATNVLALAAQPDIAMTRATTTDAETVTVNYQVTNANINDQPIGFEVYRSPIHSSLIGAVPIGFGTVSATDTPDLTEGSHTGVQLSLRDAAGNPVTALPPDAIHPYIIVQANYDSSITESDSGADGNDTAWFQKHVLGVVAHGLTLPTYIAGLPRYPTPTWELLLVATLVTTDHYDAHSIPFNWVQESSAWQSNETQTAGDQLEAQLVLTARQIAAAHDGDVVDVHFIGHSRGADVISRALLGIDLLGASEPELAGGYMKMTLLDPHPASNSGSIWTKQNPGYGYAKNAIGRAALNGLVIPFQNAADDPNVVVPPNVKSVELFYQNTTVDHFSLPNIEAVVNLWGEGPGQISDPSGLPLMFKNLSNVSDPVLGFIGHSEITTWYQNVVADTSQTLSYDNWTGTASP